MNRSLNYFFLLFSRQFDEVNRVTGDPNGKLRILLRMLHRVDEKLSIKDIDIDMVSAFGKVAV